MAKPFTPIEVKRLIGEHQSYLSQLNAGESITEKYQAEIVKASKAFVAKEALNLLKEIPVEELETAFKGVPSSELSSDKNIVDVLVDNI